VVTKFAIMIIPLSLVIRWCCKPAALTLGQGQAHCPARSSRFEIGRDGVRRFSEDPPTTRCSTGVLMTW
jgi:hypothetical protein